MCSFDNNNLVSEYEPSACKLQYCIVRHFQILLIIKNGSSCYNIQSCAWSELSLELTLLSGICRTQEPMHNNSMHSNPCTRSHAQGPIQEIPCKRSHARDPIQEIPCTRSHAQDPMHKVPYKRFHARDPMHKVPCKRSHAWDPMQRFHARDPMHKVPCKRSHARDPMQRSHARDPMHEISCTRFHVWEQMYEIPWMRAHVLALVGEPGYEAIHVWEPTQVSLRHKTIIYIMHYYYPQLLVCEINWAYRCIDDALFSQIWL